MPTIARLKYAGDVLLLTEVQLGTVSSGLALVNASMGTTAAGASVLGKTSFANKLIYRAGWIGLIGATFEVGSLAIYGHRKFNDGNKGFGFFTVGAGFSIAASAYAGFNLGLLTIASPAAVLPALPLLAIMFVGMTLSYTFQRLAYKFDDKQNVLIEYWLDNSVFGNKAMKTKDYYLINPFQTKPAFNSLTEDIGGFITASTLFLANNRLQTFQGNVPVEYKTNASSEIRLPPVFGSVREHLTLFESQIHIGNLDKAIKQNISGTFRNNALVYFILSSAVSLAEWRADQNADSYDLAGAVVTNIIKAVIISAIVTLLAGVFIALIAAIVGGVIVAFTIGTGGIGGVVIVGLSAVVGGYGGSILGGSLGELGGNIVYEATRN